MSPTAGRPAHGNPRVIGGRIRVSTVLKTPEMARSVTEDPKVFRITGVCEHHGSIATHQLCPAGFKHVTVIKHELLFMPIHGAKIDGSLTVILALVFQGELENPVKTGLELCAPNTSAKLLVSDNLAVTPYGAYFADTEISHHGMKVSGVHHISDTFSDKDGVVSQGWVKPPI